MQQDAPLSLPEAFAMVIAAEPARREALIRDITGSNSDLRDQLVRLIAASDSSSGESDPLSDDAINARRRSFESGTTAAESHAPIGTQIAGYEIQSVLGSGGMGTVYLATQRRPTRQVALKVLRSGLSSERLLRRFELESETLGRLRHPGIAQIYEAGVHEGRPYFAMEYIDGPNVTDFARKHGFGTRQKLQLIAQIASAVQHAHQHGVIHRDLKPANILVTQTDADDKPRAQPKILDFGVAKVTESDIAATTMQTDIGQLIGTLAYMSPEQASGDPANVDTRSDVYALGVIAFELLTGKLPLNIGGRLIHEAVRIIREEEPTRLSLADRTLRGDVETIIATSLEKDPSRRYDSPAAFAGDIERYLRDVPILARPASAWYQLRKYSKRHRQVVVGITASFALLIAGLTGTSAFAIRAERANTETARALEAERLRGEELEAVAKFQEDRLAKIDAMTIGHTFRQELAKRIEANADTLGVSPADLLSGIDFTGLSLEVLRENVFEQNRRSIDSGFADRPLLQARMLQSLARSAERVGLLDLAESAQLKTCEICQKLLGPEHPETLSAQSNLGLVLIARGDLADAEPLLTQTLTDSRRVLGDRHPNTLGVLDNIGLLMLQLSRFDESEAYFREALEGYRATLTPDAPELLAAINNFASVFDMRGDYAGAEPYLRDAYEGNTRLLGPDDAKTLSSANNVAVCLKRQGRLDESEPYYAEAYEGRRRTLGEDHPMTVRSLNNMAGLYSAQKEHHKAEQAYRAALDKYRRINGNEHPDTVIALNNLGAVLRDLERYDESEQIGAEAVERARRVFPPGHWLLGAFLLQHAETLLRLNRIGDALARGEEAHRIMLGSFGDQHPNTKGAAGLVLRAQQALVGELRQVE